VIRQDEKCGSNCTQGERRNVAKICLGCLALKHFGSLEAALGISETGCGEMKVINPAHGEVQWASL
jgi:hypothetical protein